MCPREPGPLGTIFGSEITRKYPEGLPDDTFTIRCCGSGGQSFGAFIPRGLTLELEGDSKRLFWEGTLRRTAYRLPAQGACPLRRRRISS